MSDKTHETVGLPPPSAPSNVPLTANGDLIADEEELAKKEIEQKTLSKARLRDLAKKNPPLPEWFDEEEEAPF